MKEMLLNGIAKRLNKAMSKHNTVSQVYILQG